MTNEKVIKQGRPPFLSDPKLVSVLLSDYQREWANSRLQDKSVYIRGLIDADIEKQNKT